MPLATLSRPRQKTPRLRRIERTLDTLERRFVRAVRRLLADRVRELEPVVERALATGRMDNLTLPKPGAYERLLVAFVVEAYGAGMGHGQAEVDDLRRRQTRRARLAGPDGEPVVPEGAVGFVRGRRDLARFFEKDQAETVRRVLSEGLEQGQSLKQVMKSLEEALPGQMGRARLENIARTEATTAYNQGRLAMFLDSDGFIAGVEFMAILDARTTDICQHRDGLVFRLDDPAIRQNTPPLHYQCRSILSPVPVTALKDSDLERTRQRMATAPGPQVTKRGTFGNEPWPDVKKEGREEFKRRAEEKIREAAPKGTFDDLVPESVKRTGDEFLKNSDSTAYNVALSDDYVEVHTGERPVFIYHQYPGQEEHGAEMAAVFRDMGLPHEFQVMGRASTVEWDPKWPKSENFVSEVVDGRLMARTVEYAMVFDVQDVDQVHRMLAIIRNQFTKGQRGYPGSWGVPDARIVGVPSAAGSNVAQVQWISRAERIFNLTAEILDMAPEVNVNSELWEFLA